MVNHPVQIYQIKVTLRSTRPSIWRRILVPGSTTLLKLHDILQIVMGWENAHLHMFKIPGLNNEPMEDVYGDMDAAAEARCKLSQMNFREGQRFTYIYDFGDSWEHTLVVEKILLGQERLGYPICMKGKCAGPPEDVGGVWGYENFLKAIHDLDHEEHEDYLNWIGEEFDPVAFDLNAVNDRLRHMGRGWSTEYLDPWSVHNSELASEEFNLDPIWSHSLPEDQQRVVEELPLRRDVIALLTYLHDNKVTGTPSTGNLPLKAVNEICSRFVDPPKLEFDLDGRIYRVRSESDVWPLHFRHLLASLSHLVDGGMGRYWRLTPRGEQFLGFPAPMQVWLLLMTWWTRANWAIASPYFFGDGYMPSGFSSLTLNYLRELPVGETVSFEYFANRMIEDARLSWIAHDQDSAQFILHAIIERVVINPLAEFGILQMEHVPHKRLGAEFRELSTFRITTFGMRLLDAINDAVK